jgi:hypothetical protein
MKKITIDGTGNIGLESLRVTFSAACGACNEWLLKSKIFVQLCSIAGFHKVKVERSERACLGNVYSANCQQVFFRVSAAT